MHVAECSSDLRNDPPRPKDEDSQLKEAMVMTASLHYLLIDRVQREAGVSEAVQVSFARELRDNEIDELQMFSVWRHQLGNYVGTGVSCNSAFRFTGLSNGSNKRPPAR